MPDDLGRSEAHTVLLLEDDPVSANLLKSFLEERNFRVTHVTGGAEGVQKVMAVDFDVILCDMVMPAFPGDMFYRAVERTRPHLCRRFIFMRVYALETIPAPRSPGRDQDCPAQGRLARRLS